MLRPAFLEYKEFRYLKAAALLAVGAILAFWLTHPAGGVAYGGTWPGYAFGIAAALLVLLLGWYGVRKRCPPRLPERRQGARRAAVHAGATAEAKNAPKDRRRVRAEDHWRYGGSLQGWLSAHVYLGLALVVLASLHAGFRFGWNLHTLTYVLVWMVVASGMYGTFAYLRYPSRITQNIGADSLHGLLAKIAELDELARLRALELPDAVNLLVAEARQETRTGGNLWQQLYCGRGRCPTAVAVRQVQDLAKQLVDDDQPRLVRDLHAVLLQKQKLLRRVRKEIRFNARMKFWLYLHGPLSLALLAALLAHVLTILIYW